LIAVDVSQPLLLSSERLS